ncbi:MAG: nuclear transport factor 2 family protein [Candidatus Solibacter sp.]
MATNQQLVSGIYEAFGRGDLAAVIGALADDVVWEMPGPAPFAGKHVGHAGVEQFFTLLLTAVRIEDFQVDAITGDGDQVVALGRERCTVHANGRSYTQHWAHAYTLKHGKVSEMRLFEDTAAQAAAFA